MWLLSNCRNVWRSGRAVAYPLPKRWLILSSWSSDDSWLSPPRRQSYITSILKKAFCEVEMLKLGSTIKCATFLKDWLPLLGLISNMKKLTVVLKFMLFLHKTKHHCVVWSYCLKMTPQWGLWCYFGFDCFFWIMTYFCYWRKWWCWNTTHLYLCLYSWQSFFLNFLSLCT